MRKTGIAILLLLYTLIQVGTLMWHAYKPVIHAICYNVFRLHENDRDTSAELTIKTNRAFFNTAQQDDGHEIRWQDEWYDIKSMSASGDSLVLTVEKDVTETVWMSVYTTIQQQLSKSKSSQPPVDGRFYRWMFKLFTPTESIASSTSIPAISNQHNVYTFQYVAAFFPDSPCQPPDIS